MKIFENLDYEETTIEIPGKPDIKFSGAEITSSSESTDMSNTNYSGSNTYWRKFQVFKTKSGKFVGVKSQFSRYAGERATVDYIDTEKPYDLVDFFGFCDLAKNIYYDLGIDACLRID